MNAKIDFEYIKGTACAGKVKSDLEACLNSRTKGILGEIAKAYGLEGTSKMKKAELTDLVSKAILSDYQQKLAEVPTEEKTVFENLCDCEVLPLDGLACEKLVKNGIAYVFSTKEEYSVTVPEELREVTVEVFEQNTIFDRYITGAISLYGYVEVSFLARLIASFAERKEIESEFKKYVEQASAYTNDYILSEGHIIAKDLCEDNFEKLTKLKSIIDGEPIFKPTKEIFDIYCDGEFEINSQIKKLTDFAYKYVTANLGEAQRIVGSIVDEHRSATTYAIERYASKFAANGYKFTTVQVEAKVVALIVEVINSVRLWAYRGYTATEKKELLMGMKMKAAKRPVAPITTVNIGRNDPCPCGSGKKYKKCCGR